MLFLAKQAPRRTFLVRRGVCFLIVLPLIGAISSQQVSFAVIISITAAVICKFRLWRSKGDDAGRLDIFDPPRLQSFPVGNIPCFFYAPNPFVHHQKQIIRLLCLIRFIIQGYLISMQYRFPKSDIAIHQL